jgi:hypothetical protein
MIQSSPFEQLKIDNDIDIKDILSTADNSAVGYIVECDLKFPKEIYDKLKEYHHVLKVCVLKLYGCQIFKNNYYKNII